jgi:hypothetical protein
MSRQPAAPILRWLPWGDAASLILFTLLGLRFHKIALTPYEALQTALPLLAAWFAVARLLGIYQRAGLWSFLLTWILSVPIGLALRQLWLGRPFGPSFLVFLGVGGTLTLVFLGLWRIFAMLLRSAGAGRGTGRSLRRAGS